MRNDKKRGSKRQTFSGLPGLATSLQILLNLYWSCLASQKNGLPATGSNRYDLLSAAEGVHDCQKPNGFSSLPAPRFWGSKPLWHGHSSLPKILGLWLTQQHSLLAVPLDSSCFFSLLKHKGRFVVNVQLFNHLKQKLIFVYTVDYLPGSVLNVKCISSIEYCSHAQISFNLVWRQ